MTDISAKGRIAMRRRTVLTLGVGAAAAAVLPRPDAAFAAEKTAGKAAGKAVGRIVPVTVEGTGISVRLAAGAAATVLVYVARRFHYEIDTLRAGDLVADPSGVAIDIRPGFYPAGVTGGFLPYQLIVIRDILAQCDGLVRWGGDSQPASEGRFELVEPATDPKIGALAKRLGLRSERPGAGMAKPFTAARIKKAETLRKRMAKR
jgi:hypothetical protein